MSHLGVGRGHIIQVIFPEPFWNLDILYRKSVEIILRRVVRQMRLKDADAEKEGFLQLALAQLILRPIGGDAIGVVIQGRVRVERTPISLPRPPPQGRLGVEFDLVVGRHVLRLARVVLIEAPPLNFSNEMTTVKQFPNARYVVAILLEKLGQQNRVVEDRISRKRILVYIIA